MNRDDDAIFVEALRWHAASVSDSMDWDGFTAWLEADDRHRDAYDAVALGDAAVTDHRDALRAALAPEGQGRVANDDPAPAAMPAASRRGWMRWAGVAIAASLVAVIAVPQFLSPPSTSYATGATRQTIALADGSQVILAPRSTLTVSGRSQERMALSGGAWFDIRHDPARALAIRAGAVEITDIGTRFDVQAGGGEVRIEVAEGQVSVGSAALDRPIRLTQGRSLAYDARAGSAVVQPIAAADIGEWRSGRLSFDAVPLSLVVGDLQRYAGTRVTVERSLRDRQFSGTLVVGDGEAALRDLSQLMGVELRRGPDGLMLAEPR